MSSFIVEFTNTMKEIVFEYECQEQNKMNKIILIGC